MTKLIPTLALALALGTGLALAPRAQAAPTNVASVSLLQDRLSIGFGTGWGGGYSGGYYATQYRWVQTYVFLGYDRFGGPVYDTRWVQQPFQVWVPATYYSGYPSSGFGIGFSFGSGHRWHR